MTSPYDCQTCGACCASSWTSAAYVRLYDIDLERLRGLDLPIIDQAQGEGEEVEYIPKLGTKIDSQGRKVCVALDGLLGSACACGIYEQRPESCRKFEAGTLLCRQARQARGLPV